MSDILTIEGKEYLPASAAADKFGYTKDYILQLIKNGRIEGQKIGNMWYVHPHSAEHFFVNGKKEREARRKRISQERKEELRFRTAGRTVRVKDKRQTAVLETLVIAVLGLSLGVTGYVGTISNVSVASEGDYSYLETLALSFYKLISPSDVVEEKVIVQSAVGEVSFSESENDSHININTDTESVSEMRSFIVAPEDVLTAESIGSIKSSFSDEVDVSIDPEDPDTGIIIPRFKNTDGEAYRFLMVPVKQAENL